MTEYEDRGERITGSRFLRDYCVDCNTPIRVAGLASFEGNYCEKCKPHRPPEKAEVLTARQRAALGR